MDAEAYKNMLCLVLSKTSFSNCVANTNFIMYFAYGKNVMQTMDGFILQSLLDSISVLLHTAIPKLPSLISWMTPLNFNENFLEKVDLDYIKKQVFYIKTMMAVNTPYHNLNLQKKDDYFES